MIRDGVTREAVTRGAMARDALTRDGAPQETATRDGGATCEGAGGAADLVSVPLRPPLRSGALAPPSFRFPRGPVVPGPPRGHAPLTAPAGASPVFVTVLSVTPAVFRPCRSRRSSQPARVVRAKLRAMKISAMTVKVAIVLAP